MKINESNKYVTFVLRGRRFGIEVLKSKEIVSYGKITPIPEAPKYIEGVINLRGSVVPVVDLTRKFFNQPTDFTESTSIIIVEPEIDGSINLMGIIVDVVKDVIEIKNETIEPPPKYGSKLESEYMSGVVAIDDDFLLMLDIDKVLSSIEMLDTKELVLDRELEKAQIMKKSTEKDEPTE